MSPIRCCKADYDETEWFRFSIGTRSRPAPSLWEHKDGGRHGSCRPLAFQEIDGMPDDQQSKALGSADIARIMQLLPHRYPFLLIDRLVDLDGEQSGTGIKNVTINEPFFQGHFPGKPVMPGVLLIEAMAQTAGALVLEHLGDEHAGKLVFFMSIDKARFRKPVVPGDTVRFHVKLSAQAAAGVEICGRSHGRRQESRRSRDRRHAHQRARREIG